MRPKIFIIGSTGKLGTLLLDFCKKKSIKIDAIANFSNVSKLKDQSKKYQIKNTFSLSYKKDLLNMFKYFKTKKIDIVYFLDTGAQSLFYLDTFNNFQKNSYIAIANKELVITAGPFLKKFLSKNNNHLIPLDSEHFSLIKTNLHEPIRKIFITASGGPFFYKKNINLDNVKKKSVLSHPKWIMGNNNLIDSSNLINKILEIFELSHIFNINLKKIDFLLNKEAYVHSLVEYEDNTIQLNCFENDMLITLSYPLRKFFDFEFKNKKNVNFFSENFFKLDDKFDQRFKIIKKFKTIKDFKHTDQIQFLLLNKIAQKKYLNNQLKYNNIVDFIFNNIDTKYKNKLNNFNDIIRFLDILNSRYLNL